MFEIGKLTRLPLGYVGESNSRTISIDISEWLKEYPGALVMIQVVRPVDKYKYPAAYTLADGVLHWTVDGAELVHAGKGLAQISLYDPDTKREYKSRVVGTIVAESLGGFNEIALEDGDPAGKWVNQTLEAAELAKDSADAAAAAIETVTQLQADALAAIEAKGQKTLETIPDDYVTLGNHVNVLDAEALERITETEKRFKYVVGDNLFDPESAVKGVRFNVSSVSKKGQLEDYANAYAAYVRITGPGVYRLKVSSGLYGNTANRINVYDVRKRYIDTLTGTLADNILTLEITSDDVCYIGYSHYATQLDIINKPMVVKYRDYPSSYIKYTGGHVLDEAAVGVDTYPGHVQSALEQRFLDRIDLAMIPKVALRKLPKAPSGYIEPGATMPGVIYSALNRVVENGVVDEARRVPTEVSLATYYSALENPASVMYTVDMYQDSTARSTYYGANCSSFVALAYGFETWISTVGLANKYRDRVIPIADKYDLLKVKRGDLVINTIASDGDGDHVKVVRDVVYERATGKLAGFNVAEAGKPYVRVRFLTPDAFLAQLSEDQPYFVARPPEEDFGLTVPSASHSMSVYPDMGDGGKYTAGAKVQLYIPDAAATSITYKAGGRSTTVALSDMTSEIVNDVTVYNLTGLGKGEYTISTDAAPDDPCKVLIV